MSRAQLLWNNCHRCWVRCHYQNKINELVGSTKSFSSVSSKTVDVSTLVTGLKQEDVEKSEVVAAYLAANCPEYGKETSHDDDDDDDDVVLGNDLMAEEEEEERSDGDSSATRMNIREMFAYSRDTVTEEGSRACRRLRANLLIPGVIYGADRSQGIDASSPDAKLYVKTPWNQLQRELDRYNTTFESRVYDLTIYEDPEDKESGTVHRVMPRDMQRHPIWNKLYAVNYLRYFPGRIIKIPIAYVNEEESAAMKRGGFIAAVNRFVPCVVDDGVPIPENVELECTGLRLKDVVRMDRIIFPDGVRPINKLNDQFLIGTVFGKGGGNASASESES